MMVKITQKIYWSLLASTFATAAVTDYLIYDTELGRLSGGFTVQTATFGEVNNLSGSPDNANLSFIAIRPIPLKTRLMRLREKK